MAAKPRSAEGVKAKPRGRRRLARTPAKPGQEPLSGYSIENAAYYIAGQAAVARGIGATVNSARINPRSDYEGEIAIGPGRCRDLEDRHLIYLAGPFAQRRFSPRSDWRSGNDDFDIIKKRLTWQFDCSGFEKRYLAFLEVAAQRLVDYFWADIEAVAEALLNHETLTGREILAVINETRSKRRASRRPHPLTRYRALSWQQKHDVIEAFAGRAPWWYFHNKAAVREAASIARTTRAIAA